MPDTHAKLFTPSGSHRWLECTASAKLNAELADTTSSFAEEGTAAHSLCEYKVLKAFHDMDIHIRDLPDEDPTKSPYYDAEMEECCAEYCNFVVDSFKHAKDPMIFIENRLDLSRWMPGGFGTADCIICSEGVMHIIDFKYGKGVEVDAVENSQLMCYALGAIDALEFLYDDIKIVQLTIFQPRLRNISAWGLTYEDLMSWAETKLKPAVDAILSDNCTYKAGDHCRFCKAKTMCRARAEANLELARYDFRNPPELSDLEVEEVVKKASDLKDWLEGLQAYMEKKALEGYQWNEFKLVRGRSVRKIVKPDEVAKVFIEQGKDPWKPQELKTLTELEKIMGKKAFNEACGQYVMKPEGKPTLVPRSDKRDEISPSDLKSSAAEDFAVPVDDINI
jgi:hypothetical protein